MNLSTFEETVVCNYNKHFPESIGKCKYRAGLMRSISMTFYLARNSSEFKNGIPRNDMFNFSFFVYAEDEKGYIAELPELTPDSELPEKLILEVVSNTYRTVPDNEYVWAGHKKVSIRKTRGNAEKIVKTLDRFFKRVESQLSGDYASGEILSQDMALLESVWGLCRIDEFTNKEI